MHKKKENSSKAFNNLQIVKDSPGLFCRSMLSSSVNCRPNPGSIKKLFPPGIAAFSGIHISPVIVLYWWVLAASGVDYHFPASNPARLIYSEATGHGVRTSSHYRGHTMLSGSNPMLFGTHCISLIKYESILLKLSITYWLKISRRDLINHLTPTSDIRIGPNCTD